MIPSPRLQRDKLPCLQLKLHAYRCSNDAANDKAFASGTGYRGQCPAHLLVGDGAEQHIVFAPVECQCEWITPVYVRYFAGRCIHWKRRGLHNGPYMTLTTNMS